MAKFVYIGIATKDDGKVDVRCRDDAGVVREWTAVVPNVTEIDVGDSARLTRVFEHTVDFTGSFIYLRVA